jgi:peroxiredoxin
MDQGRTKHSQRRNVMHSAPKIGTTAPDFSVSDVEGKTASLTHYRDKKPVLLVLNRGFK